MSQILSDELLLKIFYYLNVNELCIVCRVSKDWYRISNDEQLWKALYAQRWTPVVEISWKNAYRERHCIRQIKLPDLGPKLPFPNDQQIMKVHSDWEQGIKQYYPASKYFGRTMYYPY